MFGYIVVYIFDGILLCIDLYESFRFLGINIENSVKDFKLCFLNNREFRGF